MNHPFDTPREIFLLSVGIVMMLVFALTPIIYLKIVKPLDKIFYGKGLTFEEGVWFASTIMRLSQYVLCIVFPNRSKNDRYAKLIYEGYDFRGNATPLQIKLSYSYLISLAIVMLGSFVLIFIDFVVRPIFG